MAFWDASAVVPLCVSQPATGFFRRLLRAHRRPAVWWGTPVEARSAFARLMREKATNLTELARALDRLARLRRSWDEILPTDPLRDLAEELPSRYQLRAADAFQLAAAVVWCSGRPSNRPFICFDRNLAAAAAKIGFAVIGLP